MKTQAQTKLSVKRTPTTRVNMDDATQSEKEFRANVKYAYRITIASLTAATSVGTVFLPPTVFIGTGLIFLLSLLHAYDKRHDYKMSHSLAKFLTKTFYKGDGAKGNTNTLYVLENLRATENTEALNAEAIIQLQSIKSQSPLSTHSFFSLNNEAAEMPATAKRENITRELAQLNI